MIQVQYCSVQVWLHVSFLIQTQRLIPNINADKTYTIPLKALEEYWVYLKNFYMSPANRTLSQLIL